MLRRIFIGFIISLIFLSAGCAAKGPVSKAPPAPKTVTPQTAQQEVLPTQPANPPPAQSTVKAPQPAPKPKPKPATTAPATPKAVVNLPVPPKPQYGVSAADIVQVEHMVVDLVNQDRQKAGLTPVTWDETAARAAVQHVQEEADKGYISHWGMDGAKPQLRYTRAGGLDAVDENESVTLWLQGGFQGVSKADLYKIVAQHESLMVNEQPPNDGHRKNILDPHHTGVGIAIAVGKYGIAMAQEFTNHYAVLNPVPLTAASGSTVTLSGRIFPGYQITGVYAVWEQLPQPMTRDQLMQTHSYSDPPWDNLHFWARPNAGGYYIQTGKGNVFAQNLSVDSQGNFFVNIPLSDSHTLDYLTLELAPNKNAKDTFYAGQFVVQH